MKRIYFLSGFLLFITLFLFQTSAISQDQILPVDNKVKIGKLNNGFTYYIRQNKMPENRFELRLAINAGSILENDNQLGLAHFVEHMCFNGTTHFEKNQLVKYLQSMGIKFGPEINAYTSFDETVYMLTIPSDSANLVENGFLIMEDWAHNVSFDTTEIDKERGVIIEEWRLGRGPWQRMQDKYLPILFKDSHYKDRLPIGNKQSLETFGYESLKSFYRDWYRPDLMALVVVGDINVDSAEKKIIQHFSNLKMPENPRIREEYTIPDHQGTIVCTASDKEAPYSVIRLLYKDSTKVATTSGDYIQSLNYSFISGMLNRRLAELAEKADPPFVGAGCYYDNLLARNKNALQGYAVVGENGIERGIKTLLEENNRIAKFGFTQGEFERYKLDFIKRYEQAYNERDKTKSEDLAGEYVRNFLEKEPIPGIEFEYELVKNDIDKIKLEDINRLASKLIKPTNRAIVINAPEKEGVILPDETSILAIACETDTAAIQPYLDKFASAQLMNELPKGGKIVKEKKYNNIKGVELKLSNGATVFLKPTDFKNDEIQLTGFAWGGTSVYQDVDHFSAMHADGIIGESGVGKFQNSDLFKVLAGKTVYVATSIGTETQDVSGNCRPADFETMMQLLYLKFTSPRVDDEAFESYITKNKNLFMNLSQEPMNYFYDKYNRIRSQNHPRGNYLPEEGDWDKIDYKRAIEIYRDRYSNAGEFTFVLVGAFDIEKVKPLIAKYIGGLPSTKRTETYNDLGIRPPTGKVYEKVFKGTDEKSLAIVSFIKDAPYNDLDAFILSQFGQYLSRKYVEILREQMSGVYGVRTSVSLNKVPYERASITISIPCSPTNVDSLVNAAIREIQKVQENGISDTEVATAREIYKREKEKNLQENSYWLNTIENCYVYNRDFGTIESFDRMDEITSEAFKRVANQYIDLNNCLKVVLYPEKK
jgi:zinc protease